MKQASNAWGGMRKVVGEALAPAVKAAAGLIMEKSEIMVPASLQFFRTPLAHSF